MVNGAYKGNDDVGRLVHDMWQVDPDKMQSDVLSNRMKMFKEINKEGKPMSELSKKLIDLIGKEKLQEGITRTARAMLREGIPVDTIVRCTSLSIEEVERMRDEMAT